MKGLHFLVHEVRPAAKGSVRAHAAKNGQGVYTGKVAMRQMAKGLPAYEAALVLAARKAMADAGLTTPWDGPVRVILYVYFQRPKKGGTYPSTRYTPDLDKISRTVGDALTKAAVIRDDSQIVSWVAEKAYNDGAMTSVHVVPYES